MIDSLHSTLIANLKLTRNFAECSTFGVLIGVLTRPITTHSNTITIKFKSSIKACKSNQSHSTMCDPTPPALSRSQNGHISRPLNCLRNFFSLSACCCCLSFSKQCLLACQSPHCHQHQHHMHWSRITQSTAHCRLSFHDHACHATVLLVPAK